MASTIIGQTLLRATPLLATGALLAANTSPLHAEDAPSPSSSDKLPIYPLPDPVIKLVPTQTELERQIGSARKSLHAVTQNTQEGLQGSIEKWIGVEKKIEHEVKSLVPANEPLTPGLLYVGVATLAGSVFTRFRALPIRLLTPPLFLLASLNYFQPKLSHNLASYYTDLERAHAPGVTDHREALVRSVDSLLQSSRETVRDARQGAESSLRSGLDGVERSTGLKVGDVLGGAQAKAEEAKVKVKDQMRAV